MPTFVQEAFKTKSRGRIAGHKRNSRRAKRRKKSGYSLGKESEAIVRTTGTLMGLGAGVAALNLIGKLGK